MRRVVKYTALYGGVVLFIVPRYGYGPCGGFRKRLNRCRGPSGVGFRPPAFGKWEDSVGREDPWRKERLPPL